MHFDYGIWYNTEGNQFGYHKYFRGIKPSGCGGKNQVSGGRKKSIYSFKGKGNEIIPWDEPFSITA